VSDFAVWKFIQPGEKHAMRWDYLGRPGYPGWHLECATIIHKELGEPIDIHTGGIDHIPVHHTNEIAETYAAWGTKLSRFWLHCDFITIDGQKISKSLGNVYTLEDLEAKGFSALDYKMWLLSGHYQGTRNFTFESLEAAKNRRTAWRARIAACYQKPVETEGNFTKVLEAVNDNLNSAEACAIIDNSILSLNDWRQIDELFGLGLIAGTPDVSDEVYDLSHERDEARKNKDFAKSDEIRNKLEKQGILLKDTPDGGIWYYL
jgi:cysteinyl-tRNA synthetase